MRLLAEIIAIAVAFVVMAGNAYFLHPAPTPPTFRGPRYRGVIDGPVFYADKVLTPDEIQEMYLHWTESHATIIAANAP